MSDSLDRKIEQVKQRLQEHLGRSEGLPANSTRVVQVTERPFSSTVQFAADFPTGAKLFVMKSVTHHPVISRTTRSENQAEVEYRALKKLHPLFRDVDRCAVPEPVLVIPELDTYVMRFVDGELLVNLNRYARYLSSPRRFEQLAGHYFAAGTWLRQLHQFTGIDNLPAESLDGVIERCRHRLELIEESGCDLVPADFRGSVSRYVEEQLGKVDRVPNTGRHGDFGPWNILAGDDGITVIDFMGYRKDPLPVDLTKMLVFLEDEARSLSTSRRRADALRESFLRGYGPLPRVDGPVWNICEAMQRVVAIWSRLSAAGRRPHHRIEIRRAIRANVGWFSEPGPRPGL